MTVINLNLAKELDGSTPYMACAFIDSYGDVLLKVLTLDDIAGDNKLLLDNYFTPCGGCGLPVVDSSIVPDTQGICDHCVDRRSVMLNMALTQTLPEDVMRKQVMIGIEESIIKVNINTGETMGNRTRVAIEQAAMAFWDVIARAFPEATDGQYLMEDISVTLLPNVKHWLELNILAPEAEKWTEDMKLNYPEVWHLHDTGGHCMVVVSDNVVADCKHKYIGITREHVIIFEDTFMDDQWLQIEQQLRVWSFDDTPSVLMNILEEEFGRNVLFDNVKLFHDIYKIGVSSHL
jgi:hypothetical protein